MSTPAPLWWAQGTGHVHSRTIPGVVMADIWMRIRRTLVKGGNEVEEEEADNEA